MRKLCAILDDYQDAARQMADWSRIEDRVELRTIRTPFASEDDVVAAIGDCEILVIMRERTPFPASLLARLPKLKLLVTSGMRNLAIDVAAAKARGIAVCGTDSFSEPPVEMTWALLLGIARHVVPESNALRANGPWQSGVGSDLAGRTLGLIGLGKIGARVARVARAFDMKLVAWSQNLTADTAHAADAVLAPNLESLLQQSDYVSIHVVLGDRTRGLLGDAQLRQMKPSAYLINTSRAAIVQRAALLRALQENWIAGAAMDVFETEPLPADDPLRKLPNVLATPHIGYVTQRNYGAYFEQAVEDIEAWLTGNVVRALT
ncbi:D-2-hydroxyacid dehydrogenase family protein [Roseiterribacter gracilis]|uniref:2-hydroxyacid dehydrogenase n=1 Tax=Roseiterribacter gracilis TaxID=2812848 RepID=A0A8S8XE66_9PROT|nr:2-hydroxyacid dehydrogenase [Rhodospirillales bacterium TMPK1]